MPTKQKRISEYAAFENLVTNVLATTRADLQSRLDEIKKKKKLVKKPASHAVNDRV